MNYFIERSLNFLLQQCDIKINPGPRGICSQYCSSFRWNLNTLPEHNYAKVPLLQAFTALHKFDLICPSETYLILQLQLRRSLLSLVIIN